MQGFLNLNKPQDFTSHDCVAIIRRLLGTRKVGHGGTLDPKAMGVLPVAVGRATRLLQYLAKGKTYRAVVRFGVTTATDDLEGEILSTKAVPYLSEAAVLAELPNFQGEIWQIPPSHSAIQVGGKRLYQLARQGQVVSVPPRQVVIHKISLVAWQAGELPEATLDIHCGTGTYIRSIARDLGKQVGVGATLASLQRTCSSGFDLDDSIGLDDLELQVKTGSIQLIPPERGVMHLESITLSEDWARRWCQGQKIPAPLDVSLAIPYRIIAEDNQRFIGIGVSEIRDGCSVLVPKLVLEPFG